MNENIPTLAGTHHVRLPVKDLEISYQWYAELLGYEQDFPFRDGEHVVGWALKHPAGGPSIVLMHDPELAGASNGFPFFSFGMPNEAAIRDMAKRLDARGISHGGVQKALAGVKLPFAKDPDGHLLGFYMVGPRDVK